MVQRGEVVGIGHHRAIGIRFGKALKTELHILGGHLAGPVMEHLARVQLELDLGVGILLDPLRGIGLPVQRPRLEPRQSLADGGQDIVLDRAHTVGRVKIADIVRQTQRHRAALGRIGDGKPQDQGRGDDRSRGHQELAAAGFQGHGSYPLALVFGGKVRRHR